MTRLFDLIGAADSFFATVLLFFFLGTDFFFFEWLAFDLAFLDESLLPGLTWSVIKVTF